MDTAERTVRFVDSIKPPVTSAAAIRNTIRRGGSGRFPLSRPSPGRSRSSFTTRRGYRPFFCLCAAEWEAHLHQVLPLLAVHDAARKLAKITPAYDAARGALTHAVHTARSRQCAASWQTIADVVGITRQSAHERWA